MKNLPVNVRDHEMSFLVKLRDPRMKNLPLKVWDYWKVLNKVIDLLVYNVHVMLSSVGIFLFRHST